MFCFWWALGGWVLGFRWVGIGCGFWVLGGWFLCFSSVGFWWVWVFGGRVFSFSAGFGDTRGRGDDTRGALGGGDDLGVGGGVAATSA